MKLSILYALSSFIKQQKELHTIKRISDNCLKLELISPKCEKIFLYFDLTRSNSSVFLASNLLGIKSYQAPFDITLTKLCFKARITDCRVDGNNRILKIFLQSHNHYKTNEIILQVEFTGKNTNLILLDNQNKIIDALRHLTLAQTFREVKIGKTLLDLPQPSHIKEPLQPISQEELLEILRDNYTKKLQKTLEHSKEKSLKILKQKLLKTQEILYALPKVAELQSLAFKNQCYGKALLANLYKIPHTPMLPKTLEVQDPLTQEKLTIPIPSHAKSLSDASQIFFTASKKLTQKMQNIHKQTENLQAKIDFLNSLNTLIVKTTSLEELSILQSNFIRPTYTQKQERGKNLFESFFIDGFKVSLGKSEKENIALLKEARAEDMWMHLQNIPSSHLIIHSGKGNVPLPILEYAAKLLLDFTKYGAGNYCIDYTKRKFVKITQGAQVVYSNYKTLHLSKN